MPAWTPQFACGSDVPDAAALAAAGFATVIHRASVASTMDEARALAADPAAALPAVVIADRQVAGRGRRGAGWWQADGALAASVVVAGGAAGTPRPAWALACGVAIAEAVHMLEPGVRPVVRWPNDVEVAGRKLAGILVETSAPDRAVIGVGANTSGTAAAAPPELAPRIATLPDLTGRTLSRTALLAAFLPRFLDLVATLATDAAAFVDRYRPLCALEGTRVTIHVGEERHAGVCRGVAADGAIVLDTSAGRRAFAAGSLTPPADVWPGPPRG